MNEKLAHVMQTSPPDNFIRVFSGEALLYWENYLKFFELQFFHKCSLNNNSFTNVRLFIHLLFQELIIVHFTSLTFSKCSTGYLVKKVNHKISLDLVNLDINDNWSICRNLVSKTSLSPCQGRSQHYPPLFPLTSSKKTQLPSLDQASWSNLDIVSAGVNPGPRNYVPVGAGATGQQADCAADGGTVSILDGL